MNNNKVESLISELNVIINSGMTLPQYCQTYSISPQSWAAKKAWVTMSCNKNEIDSEVADRFFTTYKDAQKGLSTIYFEPKADKMEISVKPGIIETPEIDKKPIEEIETIENDERAETQIVRDSEGKVSYYKFKIFKRDKAPLMGKLTREEMNSVYRLYSYYGANITQREISRTLPEYSLVDFKRILRVFSITKACSPFAPHMYEEYSEEELKEMHLRLKENDFIKKLEKDEINDLRKLNVKLAKENFKLSDKIVTIESLKDIIKESNPEAKIFKTDNKLNSSSLIIWLSDMHIGAYNDAYGFYEVPEYNENDIEHRLEIITKRFVGKCYDSIFVVNLGDSVDSYNKETTRGGHPLPGIITDKEMSKMYINQMTKFFINLQNNTTFNKLVYFCIGESNHDGTWGWINNKLLEAKLQNMGVETYISDYPIDSLTVNDNLFVITHGKDDHSQFKNFPLTLNDKTELYFSNWINESKLTGKHKYVVKGDLHRFAYTVGQAFDYISVGSLYGSSNWITANFGNTKWSINFMELNGEDMQIGTIRE